MRSTKGLQSICLGVLLFVSVAQPCWADATIGFEAAEGYTAGDYPPAPWLYRGGNNTTTEQVRVSNAQAHSGTQSLAITPNFYDQAVYPITVPPGDSAHFSVWLRPSNHTANQQMGGVSVTSVHPNNVWLSSSGVSFNANIFVTPEDGSTMRNLTFAGTESLERHVGDFTPLSWYKVDCDINPTQYVFSVTIDTGTYIHRFTRNVGYTVKEIVFEYAVQTVYYDDFQYTAPVIPATLTIQSALGEPVPAVGTHNYSVGNVVTCEVASVTHALTNYSAAGWTLTGVSSGSGSGQQAIFTLQGNSTLAWSWQTNYWLETSVSGSGSISPDEGFYPSGSTQGLTATPSAGWLFMGWGWDASGTGSTTVTLNGPRSVTATFSDDADNDGLTNTQEDVLGSDPWLYDTDGDGFDDGFEVGQGLSPTNSNFAIVNYITHNSSTFELYPSNTVLDVSLGKALFNVSNNEASLRLQLEKSDDLVTWTNAADAVEWMIPVNSNQKFFRVRSSK